MAEPIGCVQDLNCSATPIAQRQHRVFITGATGYFGGRLIPLLTGRGHRVTGLARQQSRHKLPTGCEVVIGDALNGASYCHLVAGADTFVQLVGVSHPGPAKASQFLEIDLRSGMEAIHAAKQAGVSHFVYVSVAHPAPVMKDYVAVRSQCENALTESGLNATILRPWYVLGPGHRWPYLLLPFYKAAEAWPATRSSAHRLGLVTLPQMAAALAHSVEHPPTGVRIVEVPQIRTYGDQK